MVILHQKGWNNHLEFFVIRNFPYFIQIPGIVFLQNRESRAKPAFSKAWLKAQPPWLLSPEVSIWISSLRHFNLPLKMSAPKCQGGGGEIPPGQEGGDLSCQHHRLLLLLLLLTLGVQLPGSHTAGAPPASTARHLKMRSLETGEGMLGRVWATSPRQNKDRWEEAAHGWLTQAWAGESICPGTSKYSTTIWGMSEWTWLLAV